MQISNIDNLLKDFSTISVACNIFHTLGLMLCTKLGHYFVKSAQNIRNSTVIL